VAGVFTRSLRGPLGLYLEELFPNKVASALEFDQGKGGNLVALETNMDRSGKPQPVPDEQGAVFRDVGGAGPYLFRVQLPPLVVVFGVERRRLLLSDEPILVSLNRYRDDVGIDGVAIERHWRDARDQGILLQILDVLPVDVGDRRSRSEERDTVSVSCGCDDQQDEKNWLHGPGWSLAGGGDAISVDYAK